MLADCSGKQQDNKIQESCLPLVCPCAEADLQPEVVQQRFGTSMDDAIEMITLVVEGVCCQLLKQVTKAAIKTNGPALNILQECCLPLVASSLQTEASKSS